MKSILKVFFDFVKINKSNHYSDKKYSYIFYEIVDFNHETQTMVLKCVNTFNHFTANLTEITLDDDIIYFMHPVHSCFIGIEYARYIKRNGVNNTAIKSRKDPIHRYGDYDVLYTDRKRNICFIHTATQNKFTMDPRDIVLSSELICGFDSSQAFYIGLEVGYKLDNQIDKNNYDLQNAKLQKRRHLSLVKN